MSLFLFHKIVIRYIYNFSGPVSQLALCSESLSDRLKNVRTLNIIIKKLASTSSIEPPEEENEGLPSPLSPSPMTVKMHTVVSNTMDSPRVVYNDHTKLRVRALI